MGATAEVVDELLAYNENRFLHNPALEGVSFPLPDELFVAAWEGYLQAARQADIPAVLREVLVQLRFPVREGMSEEIGYRAATRRGESATSTLATGLDWQAPDRLQLTLHPTPAGRIPVIVTGHRTDFENLVRAITARNEPKRIPASMGAVMVAGYNNWQRIGAYKSQWLADNDARDWETAFKQLIARKELYQDSFIIASRGPYSGISASSLGLDEQEWSDLSLSVRLNHECAHYFSKRVLSSMQNNLLDEIIADYMGIVAAAGRYRADWFLHFVGLENSPQYRVGGRLENYRGEPPMSDGAFIVLQRLTCRAATVLELFDAGVDTSRGLSDIGRVLDALTRLTLEELACDDAPVRILAAMPDT
jgi:hypothetical protein